MNEKRVIIIAGPNGSGKTTFALEYTAIYGFQYLGADAMLKNFHLMIYRKLK